METQNIETTISELLKAVRRGIGKRPISSLSKPDGWLKGLTKTLSVADPRVNKAATTAAKFCAAWFANSTKKQPWLVLGGQTGTGKTHIARTCETMTQERVVDACLTGGWQSDQLPEVFFWRWPLICAAKREVFDEMLPQALKGSCLFIDDIGAESEGFKNAESLARLLLTIDYRDGKFTMMTTNVPREQWKDVYDQRIADRMFDAVYVSLFDVPSYRIQRRKE